MVFEPKISIVIPVYNGANYLREAVDSALRQTYENVEIIVVNDGSNDGNETEKIAKSYGNRIRYFYKENGGVASALNYGIRNMTGEYFSWLSHDDVYYPFKLERQVKLVSRLTNKDVILYSDFELIDSAGNRLSKVAIDSRITKTPLRAILSTSIHGCTTFAPKEVFDSVGLFNEDLKTTQDNEMWLRMYMKGYSFIHLPEILIRSRVHEAQGQRKLADINRTETKKFYSWALAECRESVHKELSGILEALGISNIDVRLSVFRKGGKSIHQPFLIPLFFYKMRLLSRKAKMHIAGLVSK